MSTAMIAPEAFALRPVDRPWRLILPRTLHGWRCRTDSRTKEIPTDVPGSKSDHHCWLAFLWFVRGAGFVAVLSWANGAEVIAGARGRVRERAWVEPYRRRFASPIEGLHRKLASAGLPGFPHADLLRAVHDADLALALDVADLAVRRLVEIPPKQQEMRGGEAWLRRQLDGLGEKGGAR